MPLRTPMDLEVAKVRARARPRTTTFRTPMDLEVAKVRARARPRTTTFRTPMDVEMAEVRARARPRTTTFITPMDVEMAEVKARARPRTSCGKLPSMPSTPPSVRAWLDDLLCHRHRFSDCGSRNSPCLVHTCATPRLAGVRTATRCCTYGQATSMS